MGERAVLTQLIEPRTARTIDPCVVERRKGGRDGGEREEGEGANATRVTVMSHSPRASARRSSHPPCPPLRPPLPPL